MQAVGVLAGIVDAADAVLLRRVSVAPGMTRDSRSGGRCREVLQRLALELDLLPGALGVDQRRLAGHGDGFLKRANAHSALTVAVKFAGSVMPSRTKVLKPGSVKVTVYSPGTEIDQAIEPFGVSDARLRTFSISAGLAASTVTPGSTAPDGRARRR